jgi:EpsI family protein
MNKITAGFIALVIFTLLAGMLSLNLFLKQRTEKDLIDIRCLPYSIGSWTGKDMPIEQFEYDILETHNIVMREYVNKALEKVFLFAIYSEKNRSVIHPPEVCIIGSGVNIIAKEKDEMISEGKTIALNKITAETNGKKQLILYLFKAGSFYTNNYYFQQIHFILNRLYGKEKVGGALIKVSMARGEDKGLAEKTLKDFMAETIKSIEQLKP